MAKSLLISDRYYIEPEDRYLSRAELESASAAIRDGRYVFSPARLAQLVEEKRRLEEGGSPPWWKVILFLFCIGALPLAAIIHFFIRHVF